MSITEIMKNRIAMLDGGMGTLLQAKGLCPGELPERWNITHPEIITEIHRAYLLSGSDVISTNTFGANPLKFSPDELRSVIRAAIDNARAAAVGLQGKLVALDIGPLGKLLRPYGDLEFEAAVSAFRTVAEIGEEFGADLVLIETVNDIYEAKAALLGVKEGCKLPVLVSCAFGEDGKLMTGADPAAVVTTLEGLGADAVGVNCSLGPKALAPVVKEYLKYASIPVFFKPNAGLPRSEGGRTVYDLTPADFANEAAEVARLGVSAVGGCCGTTPEYISALSEAVKGIAPTPVCEKSITAVSSYTHAVIFDGDPVIIGERINPTGKKRFKEALRQGDIGYILGEGITQAEHGAHVLDVNVGLPEINEGEMLPTAVRELQAVVDLPLEIDTTDAAAMEQALRIYNGKAMINSVSGKAESMAAVFPLAKKYGGVIVALTLDDEGIPESAEGRLAVAKRILAEAEKYGIKKKDIIFDPLAMAVSADANAAAETLRAVELIGRELGAKTMLGVSNVSFGMPKRDIISSAFFTAALHKGLDAAIINPNSDAMMQSYYAYRALTGRDERFTDYIAYADTKADNAPVAPEVAKTLGRAIEKGLASDAAIITRELLAAVAPMDIVSGEIIPALDAVGIGFEKKTVYLPQLLMAAEAAKAAFEVIAEALPTGGKNRLAVVIATVEGDIHDIGKNIVKLLLENYGFAVSDLGRDVKPEVILAEVKRLAAPICALSALMTTTVPAMAKTVELIKSEAPFCQVIVGGAVLTREYADAIGADFYGKDAMSAVRYAEKLEEKLGALK